MATSPEEQVESWIARQAQDVVSTFLDLARNDHEEEEPHERNQESMESLVRSALRAAVRTTNANAALEAHAKQPSAVAPDPSFEAMRDVIRDFLVAHTTDAPPWFKMRVAERAAKIYWDTADPNKKP